MADLSDNSQHRETPDLAATEARSPSGTAAELVSVLDRYLENLKAGQPPDKEKLLAAHPELAEQLETCLASLEFMHGVSQGVGETPAQLGDFQIVGEIGRGGMGIVYRATQISLNRHVALKVLRFGSATDPEAMQRFQTEAEMVARLHHTNIVPIFAVGQERGVNYYAMQFIEGRGLDEAFRAAQQRGESLDAQVVAQWCLQAAEALAHAHSRGVIHRDVKPSNLLLDEQGTIWLTDFGLAKRADEVTMTVAGAILGTPRYMSPEQADNVARPVDHRTDIYSLGATLYELATGQPVFTADTPFAVISQIIEAEPKSPRAVRPNLPRDLDTIIVKCLAKDPGTRYQSAKELADDLRAYAEGRPISARRASFVELASRWLARQKKSVALTSVAVAATLALVLAGAVGGYAWHRARLARVMLKTDHPPLLAEFRDDDDRLALSINLPTLAPVEIPAGGYRLGLSQNKRLSQSLDVHLARGQTLYRTLDLEDQLLWGDVKLERTYRIATFAERTKAAPAELAITSLRSDLILLTEGGPQCLSGTNLAQRWQLTLKPSAHPLLKDGMRIEWPWNNSSTPVSGAGQFDLRPFVVSAPSLTRSASEAADRVGNEMSKTSLALRVGVPFDLNADGTSDLVLAAQHQPWLIAMSGASGEPLWVVARGDAANTEQKYGGRYGAVLYPPLVVEDQDGDGVADLAVSFIDRSKKGSRLAPRDETLPLAEREGYIERWIELISGSSGKSLWRYDLPAELFALPAGEEIPADLRWYDGSSGGNGRMGFGGGDDGHYYTRTKATLERSGPHEYMPSRPELFREKPGESPRPGMFAGKQIVSLDLKTGAARTQDTTVRIGMEPRWGDLDGDGQTDLLLAEERKVGTDRLVRLAVWSPASHSVLWTRDLAALWPSQISLHSPAPAWPLVDDIDGDGLCEVLVPDASSRSLPSLTSPPWGELSLLDGRTGEPRWSQRIRNMDQQLDRFVLGPDINGDQHREVYVAALWGNRSRLDLFVDCLSGRDGQVLWRSRQPIFNPATENGEFELAELSWHADGGDGWPQLAVPARRDSGAAPDRVCFFSAGTGRSTHVAQGISAVEPADFNADGTPDLILFSRGPNDWNLGGTVQALRGVGREAWRGALPQQTVVGDLNADGVCDVIRGSNDLVTTGSSPGYEARCGRTGKPLWTRSLKQEWYWQDFFHPAAEHDPRSDLLPRVHDLDGDGTPDLLSIKGHKTYSTRPQPLVTALSGRTGRIIWKSAATAHSVESYSLVDCRDLDGDGRAEVVVVAASDWNRVEPGSYPAKHLSLLVLSGTDGSVRWSTPLVDSPAAGPGGSDYYGNEKMWLEAAYADLDGDKRLDIVLPAQHLPTGSRLAMRAFSGLDGQTLWSFPLPLDKDPSSFGNVPPAAAGDVDGDGRPEAIVLSVATESSPQGEVAFARLDLLDGATGESRWQWKTPADRWAHQIDTRSEDVRDRLRPVLVRRPGGRQWIALLCFTAGLSTRELHVVDERGELVSRSTLFKAGRNSRPRALDADGDGGDELLVNDGRVLAMLPAEALDKPLWQTSSQTQVSGVLGILPESSSGRIVVSATSGNQAWWQGIDAATGSEVWSIVGTTVNPLAAGQALLNTPGPSLPPHALQQSGEVAFVRRGVSHDDATNEAWQAFSRAEPAQGATGFDPRMLRPLPWIFPPDIGPRLWTPRYHAWSLFYGLALIALPGSYLSWLAYRRRFGLKTLLLLPVLAGVFLMGMLIDGPDLELRRTLGKLEAAFLIGPWLFAAAMLATWIWRKRWRPLLIWLAAGLLLGAAVLLLTSLNVPLPEKSLLPGERWTWDGWYWIFWPAYYAVSWATLAVVPLAWLSRFIWRKFHRVNV